MEELKKERAETELKRERGEGKINKVEEGRKRKLEERRALIEAKRMKVSGFYIFSFELGDEIWLIRECDTDDGW